MNKEISELIKFPVKYWKHAVTVEDSAGQIIVDCGDFADSDFIGNWIADTLNQAAEKDVEIERLERKSADREAQYRQIVTDLLAAILEHQPVALVGDGGKQEKLYHAYHKAKSEMENL